MKQCKYCKSEIDKKAKVCPNCRKRVKTSALTWIITILLIIVVIGAISSGTNDDNPTTDNKEKFSHTVTSSGPDEVNFEYYIEGTVTNNRDKEYSYVQIEFVCYDKDGNNLGTAIDNTNNLLGNETWKYKAMALFGDVKNVDHCDFKEITSW
ncbi:MAG: FxLYD domain-containing protein [Bacilli bacterium]